MSRELVDLGRSRKLKIEQMQGSIFTITNLSAYSIDTFTPIINLPQSAILGVEQITPEPIVVHRGIAAAAIMSLSLAFNHRVIDGPPATRFSNHICTLLAIADFKY